MGQVMPMLLGVLFVSLLCLVFECFMSRWRPCLFGDSQGSGENIYIAKSKIAGILSEYSQKYELFLKLGDDYLIENEKAYIKNELSAADDKISDEAHRQLSRWLQTYVKIIYRLNSALRNPMKSFGVKDEEEMKLAV